jgi:5-methylthioadenosine/S-adenosylhomocysteine deaminase
VVHVRQEPAEFLNRLPAPLAQRVQASNFGYQYDTDQVERLTREMAGKYHEAHGRFRMFACADWTPSSTDELYGRIKRLAKELDSGAVIHLLETPYEMLHSFRTYGKSAVARLRDIDFLGPEVVCTDCVWVTESDLPILADSGATAVYTPWHMTGFSGIAPVRQMLSAGVQVAFSIMLRSQNDGYDTLSDLGIGEHFQHLPGIRAEAIPAQTMLRSATVKGGRALTRDDSLGSLGPGKLADMVLLQSDHLYDDPFLDPTCDVHRLLIYRGRGTDVDTVIVDGAVVVEGGKCQTIDEREAFERARAGARRITGDQSAIRPQLDLAAELDPHVVEYYNEWDLENALLPWNTYNARGVKA